MHTRILTHMRVALVVLFAGAAAFLAHYFVDRFARHGESSKLQPVVVVNQDIVAGTLIDRPDQLFSVIHVRARVPSDFVQDVEWIRSRVAARNLVAGSGPCRIQDFSVAFTFPPGMQGVSVQVTDEGFGPLQPGTHVDVIRTITKKTSAVVLPNVRLISIYAVEGVASKYTAISKYNATFVVSERDADVLRKATHLGPLEVRVVMQR